MTYSVYGSIFNDDDLKMLVDRYKLKKIFENENRILRIIRCLEDFQNSVEGIKIKKMLMNDVHIELPIIDEIIGERKIQVSLNYSFIFRFRDSELKIDNILFLKRGISVIVEHKELWTSWDIINKIMEEHEKWLMNNKNERRV